MSASAAPPPDDEAALAAALAGLDAAIADRGVAIWIGAEPTFTRRESTDPWWLGQADADGADDKRRRACALAAALARTLPGARVERVVGRQYPGEDAPRFCLAVRAPREAIGAGPALASMDALALDELDELMAATPVSRAAGAACLTVTLDPGVVEVNAAPCANLVQFGRHGAEIYAAAAAAGLSPRRWRYNGDEVDSGGGGQLTFGGPTAAESPCFVHPALLPRLVRYVNNHPSLSYWFLGECAGSASQSPRPDEGVRERWEELRLASIWLEHEALRGRATPELLWSTLAPLLVDAAGNSHRAELNVEKLWSPHLGERGRLGLVELRAFRMPPTPAHLAAAAALVRAVAVRCAIAPLESSDATFVDWAGELHDRWALPTLLARDLAAVLRDLAAHGLDLTGAAPWLFGARTAELHRERLPGGVEITLSRALEFWPLIGDVASQEQAAARLVDASSERLELRITSERGAPTPEIRVGGVAVTPRLVEPSDHVEIAGRVEHLLGIRRRQYVPVGGLLPMVPASEPLELTVTAADQRLTLRWHAWRPGSGSYDGLPVDEATAKTRRAERLLVAVESVGRWQGATETAPAVAPAWTFDQRGVK